MSDPVDPQWELMVPFVACRSQGGIYDDGSFVAGFRAGHVDWWLKDTPEDEVTTVAYEAELRQLDLIAMKRGFKIETEPTGDGNGWFYVRFVRVAHVG